METGDKQILAVNGGSSSIKFALFDSCDIPQPQLTGKIDRIGRDDAALNCNDLRQDKKEVFPLGGQPATAFLIQWLKEHIDEPALLGIGHRVVHGLKHVQPERITGELLKELSDNIPYDSEHLPGEIELMKAFTKEYPGLPQFACFDTSFHAGMPRVAKRLPLPWKYEQRGIQRYGFHGISYAYLVEELARVAGEEAARGRIILAHLGNGCSLAAVREGKSMDTSMGFTPASGLVMSTRTGDLDPGIASFLLQEEKMTAAQYNKLVNEEAGLLGLSGMSGDIRDLLKQQEKDERCAAAIELFCYQAKKWIGSFTTVLAGLDTLVFSGGIGENAPEIREKISSGLQYLGIELDIEKNAANEGIISAGHSRVTVRVIPTNEEGMIARYVRAAL